MTGVFKKITQDAGLCEIVNIGTPWHGKVTFRAVTGGYEAFVVTDGNSTDHVLYQSTTTGAGDDLDPYRIFWRWQCPYVYAKPGLSTPTTTAGEIALGMEWRETALIPQEVNAFDFLPFEDDSGNTWFSLAFTVSAVFVVGDPDFSTSVSVYNKQVLDLDSTTPAGVLTTFTTNHLWSTHSPSGEMSTDGQDSVNRVLDTKNNGRTHLMGAYPIGGDLPYWIGEVEIVGSGTVTGTTVSGFSTSFSVIYSHQQCIEWHARSPDENYNNTTVIDNGLDCDGATPGTNWTLEIDTTWDEASVLQRIVGAFYESDGTITPVYLIKSETTTGTEHDETLYYKDDDSPYSCTQLLNTIVINKDVLVAYSIESNSDVVDGCDYTYSSYGTSVYDGTGTIYSSCGGEFDMPSIGVNLTYTGTNYTYQGTLPTLQDVSVVSVPGSTGYTVGIFVTITCARIFGLSAGQSDEFLPSTPIYDSYINIDAGKHYGFVGLPGLQAGSTVSSPCGKFWIRPYGTGSSLFYVKLMRLEPSYTAYNPHNGDFTVLSQYPVWYV